MSACIGITECSPSEFCDRHFRAEVVFIATYFCDDTPVAAKARRQNAEAMQEMEAAAREEDVEWLELD